MTDATQVRLANDVAAQFRHLPPDAGAAAVANHLRMFWAPSMRAQLFALVDSGAAGLDPLAVAAAGLLR
jgi:formate dehydrogenase subunit delta